MDRKLGLISILIGAFWVACSIVAVILGLTFIGGIEDTVLSPVEVVRDTVIKGADVLHDIDFLNVLKGPINDLKNSLLSPLNDLKNSIESVFTTIKLVYSGVVAWLALPQLLLICAGWRLRKLGSKRSRK